MLSKLTGGGGGKKLLTGNNDTNSALMECEIGTHNAFFYFQVSLKLIDGKGRCLGPLPFQKVIITGVSPQSAMDTKLSVKSGVCNMNKTSQTRQSFPFFD